MADKQGELLPEPQYITVRFNEWDRRTYTYENPYTPVKAGDEVQVVVSDGTLTVKVMSITTKPSFKCKQIVKPEVK